MIKLRVNNWILLVISLFLLSGCATELFYWGKYEDSLIERYVDNDQAHTEAHLRELVTEAESEHKRVPPGVYADYGFTLFKRGDKAGAISYFEKERQLYPESTPFMTKLIEKIKQQSNQSTSGAGAAQ